ARQRFIDQRQISGTRAARSIHCSEVFYGHYRIIRAGSRIYMSESDVARRSQRTGARLYP
ncbi:MAG: hypothetical protein ACTMIY_07280, partial [Microbacterium gubbeenense]